MSGNSRRIYSVALSACANTEHDRSLGHAAQEPRHSTSRCRWAVKIPSVIGLRVESN